MDKLLNNETIDLNYRLNELKKIFPECFADGGINFDKLKFLLGENILVNKDKYEFTWIGKDIAHKEAVSHSQGTLIPLKESSVNFDYTNNYYIEGDNLESLKLLQKTFFGKIQVIYIDPPYNTGNDFVYKDNFGQSIENYLDITSQQSRANPESNGRFHTDWLNMMYSRLLIAKNLLSENGVIYISIDDNEYANLRKICDEIFGDSNFLSTIIWERAFAPVNLKKHFSTSHDYILCYAKNIEKAINKGIKRSDNTNSKYNNPDNDSRGPWTSGDLSVGPAVPENIYEIITPSGRKCLPPSGYSWRLNKTRYQEFLNDNRIWFGHDGNNVPRIKRFLSEVKQGITPMTIWKYEEVGHSQDAQQKLKALFDGKAYFDYPKPVKLIKQLISLYDSDDCYVLDFFSGSATTAQAVMELNSEDGGNRKFILVQLPELLNEKSEAYKDGYINICQIGEERIRRAGRKIYDQLNSEYENSGLFSSDVINPNSLDLGFKVFKLESTNIKPWDGSIQYNQSNIFDLDETIKEGRNNLDVAYEIMLKYGIFNMQLKEAQINNKTMYSIGDGYMIICLDNDITMDDVTAIAKQKPRCVVFKELGLKDDNVKINATYTLERLGVEDIKCI